MSPKTVYRGVLNEPIVFPNSIIITTENLNSIDLEKVIYCEISPLGAMGNEGGIIIYVLENGDNLITYETNVCLDQKSYYATVEKIEKNSKLFVHYSGGFGNYVIIKKNIWIEIDKKNECFWYHLQNTKLRIDTSVKGVFDYAAAEMIKRKTEK